MVAQALYGGSAMIGKTMANIRFILAAVIGVILVLIGLWMLFNPSKTSVKTLARIDSISYCNKASTTNNIYNCRLNLSYTVNGIVYNQSLDTTGSNLYYKDAYIDIYHDPKNPNMISSSGSTTLFALVLIILGVLIPVMAYLWLSLVKSNKTVASFSGALDVFNLFRR